MSTSLVSDVVMDGVIGYVDFFNFYKISYVVGRDLTAFRVINDYFGDRGTIDRVEAELRHLEKGDTRIHLCDEKEKEGILLGIDADAEAMLQQIEAAEKEKDFDRLQRIPARARLTYDRDLLKEMVKNNRVWTLEYFYPEHKTWCTWDETGFYVQVR